MTSGCIEHEGSIERINIGLLSFAILKYLNCPNLRNVNTRRLIT